MFSIPVVWQEVLVSATPIYTLQTEVILYGECDRRICNIRFWVGFESEMQKGSLGNKTSG